MFPGAEMNAGVILPFGNGAFPVCIYDKKTMTRDGETNKIRMIG
jgi:hypothetical protein